MLDPQVRALLDLMRARRIPEVNTLEPAEARRLLLERRTYTQPDPPAVAEVVDLRANAGAMPVRACRPSGSERGRALPVLVYYHGGGWTIGDLDTHDVLCRQLANGSGCVVVSVDYRKAPEHRFPAAVDDGLEAVRWVRANAVALGVDASRLAVGGDSAGGNIAAVASLLARDAGDPPIAFQLLLYPVTDLRLATESYRRNGQGYLLTRENMVYFRAHYIDDPAQWSDWRASPLLHPDLSRLPPALVLTAGFDPLRDEGLAYAQRLSQEGNRCTYVCFERQIHGFMTMGRVIGEAQAAVELSTAMLRWAFGSNPG
jgi:acetyl esterase